MKMDLGLLSSFPTAYYTDVFMRLGLRGWISGLRPAAPLPGPAMTGPARTVRFLPQRGRHLATTTLYDVIRSASQGEILAMLAACQRNEGGEAEGTLVFATSGSLSVYNQVFEPFREESGVRVEVVRKPPEMVAEMVTAEAAAGRSSIDLIHITAETMLALQRDGYLADFVPEEASPYPQSFKYGNWGVAVRQNYHSVVYNRERLEGEGLRLDSFRDLAEPEWRGHIGMEFPERSAGSGFAFLHTLYRLKRIDRSFLERLHQNQPIFGRSAPPHHAAGGRRFYGLLERRDRPHRTVQDRGRTRRLAAAADDLFGSHSGGDQRPGAPPGIGAPGLRLSAE